MERDHPIFDQIADGLSEPGFAVIPEFLSDQEVADLQEVIFAWKEEGEMRRAGIGSQLGFQVNREIRGDLIRWVDTMDPNPAVTGYLDRIKRMMEFLNRTCFLGLKDFEMHYTAYPSGTFYQRHSDRFQTVAHRVVSVVLYLNPDWKEEDGGQLIIYHGDEEREVVSPRGGTLAVFRSELEHEVLPTYQTRYSITGWMLDQLASLTFLK
ncbi:MAG: 2OG-Fe(II) oxygenase [Bacteroidota bacterium]|nr:2OG-Fe(II) oxygenase [Bacteroidota bacterium]MDX5504547.1 2OG-Fe(II) oxygenase [Bacteroidota bacterium]